MLKPVLFIGQQYITRFSAINGTVDQRWIEPAIWIAQKKWLKPLLGKCLYAKIETLITDWNDNNATGIGHIDNVAYKTLVENYIADVILHYTLVDLYPYMSAKVENSNILKHVPENSESLTTSELAVLSKREKNNAELFAKELLDFLNDNPKDYPEFKDCDGCEKRTTEPQKESGFLIG